MAKTKRNDRVSLRRIEQVLSPLTSAGARLANIAFSVKQRTDLPEDIRVSLSECQQAWDAAIRKVPNRWRI